LANQYIPIAHPGRFDVDQQLPSGRLRPRQVNVCDDAWWTELKYLGCFHLSSSASFCADATVLLDSFAFMRAVSPLTVLKGWCTLRSTHRRSLYLSNRFQCFSYSVAFR